AAWVKGDYATMYGLLDAKSRAANPQISFDADYKRAMRAAGAQKIALGTLAPLGKDGTVAVPVTVPTKEFGSLKGTLTFHASEDAQGNGRVAWTPALRLPGLKDGEEVKRTVGAQPTRGNIYDASGRLLDSDPTGASIAGVAGKKPTGLERIYDDRL